MLKGILRGILLICLLVQPTATLLATTDHFWLLQEYGIEKRSLADGSLLQNFASVYKPLAFSVKPKQQGIWVVADGYLLSFDANGNILKSTPLENVNQNAFLVSMPETGVWLVHGDKRYAYNNEAELVGTLDLPTNGNRINDVAYDDKNKQMWLTTASSIIAINQENSISEFKLEKNEKINGITTTKNGDIALIVTTPQPEFRLYTHTFETLLTLSLDNVSPAPDNLVETKDGKYWLAGKQHAILLDKESGIIVNHEFNSDIPQGPGETQLITDNADNSAWVLVGRQLMHVSANGDELHRKEGVARNIDVQVEGKRGSPPEIQFYNLNDDSKQTYFYYPGFFVSGRTIKISDYYWTFEFGMTITDPDEDVDHTSFEFTLDEEHPQRFMLNIGDTSHNAGFTFSENNGFSVYCSDADTYPETWRSLLGYPSGYICLCSASILSPEPDKVLTLSAQISDLEGNISNIPNKEFFLDTTPPSLSKDLITLTIDGENVTVSGVAGSAEHGGSIEIRNTRLDRRIALITDINEDGSFESTFKVVYADVQEGYYATKYNFIGDVIELNHTDQSGNISNPLEFTLGYKIDLKVNSPASNQVVNKSFTVIGSHNIQSEGTITAIYWDGFE